MSFFIAARNASRLARADDGGDQMTEAQITEAGAKAFVDMHHDLNLGAMVLGMIVDCLLCGVMLAQLLHYYKYSKDDRLMVKAIVAVSAIFALAGTGFILFLMCHFFVDGFGTYTRFLEINYVRMWRKTCAEPSLLADSPWMAFIGIIPSVAVQTFFGNRAYNLTGKSKILAGLLALLITVSLAGAIGTIPAFANLGAASESDNVEVFMYLWLLGGCVADVLITGCITRALLSSRSEFSETRQTVKKLIQLVIETQLPPTILLLCFLIAYRVSVDSYLSFFFEWIGPKAYVCGMLASLNSRHALRRTIGSENTTSRKGSSYQLTERPAVVHVLTETFVHDDTAAAGLPIPGGHPSAREELAQVPYTPHDFDYPPRASKSLRTGYHQDKADGLNVGVDMDDESLGLGNEVKIGRGKGRDGYIP
ncbi:hypothetical protein I316_00396 [Kwoniella heveanensis BCC8398]|uniref:DUF6534 domain-containing protein n=1 Tax=Kwoniella heveanensis BCC8398 TaxID=1296120 RepID=A0A1B9H4H6_9TREE|nr:hypothetical protein I316_00396 [Kwoniella heveanensis BCC8398]